MNEFNFSIHGVTVRVRSLTPRWNDVLQQLAADFDAFPESGKFPQISLDLMENVPAAANPLPTFAFQTRMVRVYGWGKTRVCLYPEGTVAASRSENGVRHFWLSGSNAELMREVAYTILLSATGEELDSRGFHRAHGLGIEFGGRRVLLLADSGLGKSSLAVLLNRRQIDVRLFSDESPLIHTRLASREPANLHTFPLRLSLAPPVADAFGLKGGASFVRHHFGTKRLFAFPKSRLARSGPLDVLLIGKATKEMPMIRRCGRLSVVASLFKNLVIGVGLAQMKEWMLRGPAIGRLVRIAALRTGALIRVLWSAEIYEFRLSPNAHENTRYLEDFLMDKAGYEKIKIRFNTDKDKKDVLLPPWRVIANGVERLANQVIIQTPAVTTQDEIAPGITKWHISCEGSAIWDDDRGICTITY